MKRKRKINNQQQRLTNQNQKATNSKNKKSEKEEMKNKSMHWLPGELKPVHVLVVFFSSLSVSVPCVCVLYNVVVYGCLTMNIFFSIILLLTILNLCIFVVFNIVNIVRRRIGCREGIVLLLICCYLRLLITFALCILHKNEMQFFINDIRISLRISLLVLGFFLAFLSLFLFKFIIYFMYSSY